MTQDDVRAAAEQLVQFHELFAPLFGTEQAHDHAATSLKGLRACPERQRIEPIALGVGLGPVSGLQKFLGVAPWQSVDLPADIPAPCAEHLVPSATRSPIGGVGGSDESAVAQTGRHSAGVARPHHGRLGTEDHSQVGDFLVGVTPDGVARWTISSTSTGPGMRGTMRLSWSHKNPAREPSPSGDG